MDELSELYTCTICDKEYSRHSMQKKCLLSHGYLQCYCCFDYVEMIDNDGISYQRELNDHFYEKHEEEADADSGKLTCKFCQIKLPYSYFQTHMTSYHLVYKMEGQIYQRRPRGQPQPEDEGVERRVQRIHLRPVVLPNRDLATPGEPLVEDGQPSDEELQELEIEVEEDDDMNQLVVENLELNEEPEVDQSDVVVNEDGVSDNSEMNVVPRRVHFCSDVPFEIIPPGPRGGEDENGQLSPEVAAQIGMRGVFNYLNDEHPDDSSDYESD